MPMVDRPKLNFFSQGYHIILSICWQNNHHQGKESHQHVKRSKWYGPKVLLILLLLSGDIQMKPGPSTNQHITERVDGSTECNPSWSVNCGAEISGPSGCKLGDVGCLAKLPLDILQDVPMLETSELCNSPVLDLESFGESKPGVSNPVQPGEIPSYRFQLQPQSRTHEPANKGLQGYLFISGRVIRVLVWVSFFTPSTFITILSLLLSEAPNEKTPTELIVADKEISVGILQMFYSCFSVIQGKVYH